VKTHSNWNLMTSHGLVLFYLAAHPDSTMRETAEAIDLTERRVNGVIRDLEAVGLITASRQGRRNLYKVDRSACFRHHTLAHVPLTAIIDVLAARDGVHSDAVRPVAPVSESRPGAAS
jgi:hypothetical protein